MAAWKLETTKIKRRFDETLCQCRIPFLCVERYRSLVCVLQQLHHDPLLLLTFGIGHQMELNFCAHPFSQEILPIVENVVNLDSSNLKCELVETIVIKSFNYNYP